MKQAGRVRLQRSCHVRLEQHRSTESLQARCSQSSTQLAGADDGAGALVLTASSVRNTLTHSLSHTAHSRADTSRFDRSTAPHPSFTPVVGPPLTPKETTLPSRIHYCAINNQTSNSASQLALAEAVITAALSPMGNGDEDAGGSWKGDACAQTSEKL